VVESTRRSASGQVDKATENGKPKHDRDARCRLGEATLEETRTKELDMRGCVRGFVGRTGGFFVLLWTLLVLAATHAVASDGLPPSNRVTINLGETPWKYVKDIDDPNSMQLGFDDSGWQSVGVPQTPSDNDTFINTQSGGGQGYLTGNINWYRKHFTLDPSYANRKVYVEFEGAHTGVQVYINGQFIPGNSLINPNATHVIGFVPFIVDITNYVKFDGTDNVLAVKVARGDAQ
jgi:beta-galactosidase